jgi:AraC-like DNA-binding protein
MRYVVLSVFFIINYQGFSQNRSFDSLYTALENHPQNDTMRVRILLKICHLEYTSYPEKSKIHADQVVKISKEINYVKGEGEATRYIALYYWSNGNYEQATKYAYETLRIFEDISYTRGLGLCYQLLGTIHKDQNDFEKAENFHLKALRMFQKIDDKRNIAYAYNAIGILYLNSSRFDQALENFQESMKIRKEIDDKDGLSQSYVNLATVYVDRKNYDSALKYFTINLPIIQKLDNKYRMVVNFTGLGDLYMLIGNYEKSEFYFLKAVEMAKSINYKKQLLIVYEKLSQLEIKRGKPEKALTYYELKFIYNDSLYNEDKTKLIAEVEARYETEKKDQIIELLKRDSQIRMLWTNILIAAFILLAIVSVGVYFLQRYRERKNRQIFNLEIDNLTTQQQEISQRYKNVLASGNLSSSESADQRLVKKAIEVVERNISDPEFGVEKMGREMGMSRTNMHRRIKAATGFPPSEMIRNIRLRKAAMLLLTQSDSVSRISLAVGFEDQSYFSRAFKKQFGVSPSEFAQSADRVTEN